MQTADWALVVSILSFVTAAAALSWNILSFKRSGPNVIVKIDALKYRNIVTAKVINQGRQSVELVNISLWTQGFGGIKKNGGHSYDEKSDKRVLMAGSSRQFEFDFPDYAVERHGDGTYSPARKMYVVAALGNGAEVKSRYIKMVL